MSDPADSSESKRLQAETEQLYKASRDIDTRIRKQADVLDEIDAKKRDHEARGDQIDAEKRAAYASRDALYKERRDNEARRDEISDRLSQIHEA